MKKIFLFLLTNLLSITVVLGCDFCNCYFGLNPEYKKNYIGFRSTTIRSDGSHHDASELQTLGINNDDFHEQKFIYEVYGQIFLFPKLMLTGIIPFSKDIESYDGPLPEQSIQNHNGSPSPNES